METNRQKKISGTIQQDLAEILQKDANDAQLKVIISVTKVDVTTDLSIAKVFVSIFPTEQRNEIFKNIADNTQKFKHLLAQRTRHQLRKVPNLIFFNDDSLDYIDGIEKALRGEVENPIKNPDILPKRKKI
ncbi:MAG: 30S ribosome-binding factor RbfA [Bacteroidetes bacterium]|jgi:ribosome-binding factor A|nr:30S ribosome-binding factor RbfA [Bacteroidota bacterium]